MNPEPRTPLASGSAPVRPANRRANSSAFYGQLHKIQGTTPPPVADEVVVTEDGKTIRITHSDTKYTIPLASSVAVPLPLGGSSGSSGATALVATLFYGANAAAAADGHITDLAIFEFIQTLDELMVPYEKSHAYHRPLDSSAAPRVVEIAFSLPQMLNLTDLRRHEDIWGFEKKWGIEVVLQRNDVFRRHKRLAVFDMDSTLIQQEVIDEIARFIGKEDLVSRITERAMNGEIDFTDSLKQRCALLRGVPASVFDQLKPVITITPGARELCRALKNLGYKLAVLSGGFLPLANYIKNELGLDYAYANQLVVSPDGRELTGELTGDIVHAERKATLLQQIAYENGIPLHQTFAVGDGANDLKMMEIAGLGIAFNAKSMVQLEAPSHLNSAWMQDVLYILGLSKEEQAQLL
ncbi:HAD-like domain-containing protein [Tricharina praecox]|uniref:HAD-like domain-containing protein n=1 Tax=Tricharina praecox TaxID=43433 RepID=UPI0022200109|nr:HAD-like domain-containing protein [Tricharina praecox]KAI5846009.1 HAD-like domain-containing protein [Tricharina praecox]